jgi:lysyl-tRNA synthetase class 2
VNALIPESRERLAPSDVHDREDTAAIEIAGRVVEVADRSLTLADAFARIKVTLAASGHDGGGAPIAVHDGGGAPIPPGPLAPGDLAVIAGSLTSGELTSAAVIERIVPARPPRVSTGAMGAARGDASGESLPRSETERLAERGVGRGLAVRAAGLRSIRGFFEARGFIEVDTPVIVPSPGLDLHLDAFEVPGFARSAVGYLITSPEYQMKRLLAGGVPRCFQLAHCFRKGEVGRRHNPEFLMLEWYRAFARVDALIDETEVLVRHVALALTGGTTLEVGGVRVDLAGPFERLPVAQAFCRYTRVEPSAAIEMATLDEDRFFRLLVDEVEPALAREPRPVFLVDYPAPFASLARLKPDDPRVAERFELYIAGIELCNGFGELTCPREQRARLVSDQAARARLGKPVYPIDERFLAALEEGMPPAAGNALGVDRLIAACAGTEIIGAVQAFPVDWL